MGEAIRNTAILLFIRSKSEELREKQFFAKAGHRQNLKLVSLLNRKVAKVARSTQLPTFIIEGPKQVGSSFGQRFSNAIQEVFNQGFEHVIALGNDCLKLSKKHILTAAKQLEEQKIVIGPACDGGAYLIGIQKAYFKPETFECLPWQQNRLAAALGQHAISLGWQIHWMPVESDIDDQRSFLKALRAFNLDEFKTLLLQIIGCYKTSVLLPLYFFKQYYSLPSFSLRGPPAQY